MFYRFYSQLCWYINVERDAFFCNQRMLELDDIQPEIILEIHSTKHGSLLNILKLVQQKKVSDPVFQ